MKPIASFFLLLGALVSASGSAAAISSSAPAERQSVQIKQTMTPVYPRYLTEIGVMEGDARVVISVDHTGKLADWLVIGYTRPEFGDSAVEAIKRWRFEPLRIGGEPRSAQLELSFHFETSGVVVSVDINSVVAGIFERISGGREGFRPRTLKEIDRIPTPINAVRPVYPEEYLKQGIQGEVQVEFFIDQTGAVRMPVVVSAAHEDLAVFASAAVREWSFEPPTRDGKPVLVRARQVFRFGPGG